LSKDLYGWIIPPNIMFFTTRQLAVFIVLASLCIAIQLSPRIGNVEFTSIITFTMGVFFGVFIGGVFGASVMFINGFLSPWGVAGFIMPFQMAGMAIVGIAGGVYKKYRVEETPPGLFIEAAVLGAFLTLIYDIITNGGVAIQAQSAFLPVFLFGIPMSILHVVSNLALFGFAFAPLSKVMSNFIGR
jgi:lipid-A-disaccharide synthase-like uncharacterized protein